MHSIWIPEHHQKVTSPTKESQLQRTLIQQQGKEHYLERETDKGETVLRKEPQGWASRNIRHVSATFSLCKSGEVTNLLNFFLSKIGIILPTIGDYGHDYWSCSISSFKAMLLHYYVWFQRSLGYRTSAHNVKYGHVVKARGISLFPELNLKWRQIERSRFLWELLLLRS